jgi:intein-encoded DNA endonuclease-like protein
MTNTDLRNPDNPTTLHRLIDIRLEMFEVTAYEIVTTCRDAGTSWRAIAKQISDESGIDCSDVNLQNWFTVKADAA